MSNATREINRITTAIIRISMKLIVYALIILLLYEAVIKDTPLGTRFFTRRPWRRRRVTT